MKTASTRSQEMTVTFCEALFQGLAPDGGLYIPVETLNLRELFLSLPADLPFARMSAQVLAPIVSDEISVMELEKLCEQAFYFSPALKQLEPNLYVLELFHGPSAAFKDFGASFLAAAMSWFLKNENRRSIILTATSGDTGSAVAQAFYDKANIDVVILYPSGRVSPLQEKQLTTLGKNIHALEVRGSFDDCQRLVKEAFLSKKLSHLPLTSANSINLGRLLPQSLYYIWAFVQLRDSLSDDLIFSVPSGNFGNLTAGVYAWKWGLPVHRFIAATNLNDVVPEYLRTKRYLPRPSIATYSNAMDVGNPSNFERLEQVFQKSPDLMSSLISAFSVNDHETLATIEQTLKTYNYDICPHTAVGLKACQDFMQSWDDDAGTYVVLATAHPAKFLEVAEKATGRRPELPKSLMSCLNRPKQSRNLDPTLKDLEDFLLTLA